MTSYSPIDWFKLDEASGNFANSGSNTAAATPVGTPTYQVGSLNDPNAGISDPNGAQFNYTAMGGAIGSLVYLIRYGSQRPTATLYTPSNLEMRVRVQTNVLSITDFVGSGSCSTPSSTILANNWHLIVANVATGQLANVLMATNATSGTVTQRAIATNVFGGNANGVTPTIFVGAASTEPVILGAFAALPNPLTLAQAQALADTLMW
jgi:hypothetical protein